ncbi:hypothetical protein PRZ48_003984 [Zasmidium cellare]|uniref:Uncharacterized protein n=1 Tax=Zasmidium cellare TaxID=395010 RepID=A0ABR0EWK6_ZASCE|nr:hypothetical protein PRZ48_003984 [Zasmidium cellare]
MDTQETQPATMSNPKFPPAHVQSDLCLIVMVPSKDPRVHPAISNVFKRLRLWCPPGFQSAVRRANPTAEVVATDLDLEGCRRVMKGVTCCLMNTPGGYDEEIQFAGNIIQAAKENLHPAG